MPELPDIVTYIGALEERIVGQPLERVRITNPFLLRTADVPLSELKGLVVRELRRIGKRIAIGFDGDIWIVLHLMIAGRLQWKEPEVPLAGKTTLAGCFFPNGTLVLTEAGTKHRASLHVVRGEKLPEMDPGGIDVLTADVDAFRKALTTENHTVKRALTDPRFLSGIGNAYSDEILHAARLSPTLLTQRMTNEQWQRLHAATQSTMYLWIERLRAQAKGGFPKKVTAFHAEMMVHGRYGEPCRVCGEKIRRIRYADNETNYCARCQTEGKILADRALSRLLHRMPQ